jgi:hypothetical protein
MLFSLAIETTPHLALIPHEPAGSSRQYPRIPATERREVLLLPEIPANPRPGRKRHDRPVTPEVAGSSPVAPVKSCKSGCSVAGLGASDRQTPAHPAEIPHGNRRRKPPEAGNSRNVSCRPNSRRSYVGGGDKAVLCRDFRLGRQRASFPSRGNPARPRRFDPPSSAELASRMSGAALARAERARR